MFTKIPSEVEFQKRAEGLLLGLFLAQRWSVADGGRLPSEATLAEEVGRCILDGDDPDEQELLRRWSMSGNLGAEAGLSQTDLVLEYSRLGRPWIDARATAARLTSRPDLDPPLLRTLPISIACLGRGLTLRRWAHRVTAATHSDPTSQLAGFAVARLGQDLLSFGLEDALPRTAQAVREDAPESLIAALKPAGPGEGVPGGEDARGVLGGAVQALVGARAWEDAVGAASSRGIGGDQAVLLAGAFAGALLGVGGQVAGLDPEVATRLQGLARALLTHSREHANDPLPIPARISGAGGAGR